MRPLRGTSWAVIGSAMYSALFLGVYIGCAYFDVSKDASIRPDPSPAVARSRKDQGERPAPAIGLPIREASPLRVSAKRHHPLPKLDGTDPNDDDDVGAKLEIASVAPLEVDRHDPYDPRVVYPAVDMFTTPFDEADPFAESAASTAPPHRRHAKHDRHASATPPPRALRAPGTTF